MPSEATERNGTSVNDEDVQDEDKHEASDHEQLVESPVEERNGHTHEHEHEQGSTDDEDEDSEEDSEEGSEEESDDEDDDEPALKYERIGGFMPDLFKKDSAASLAISQKMVSLFCRIVMSLL